MNFQTLISTESICLIFKKGANTFVSIPSIYLTRFLDRSVIWPCTLKFGTYKYSHRNPPQKPVYFFHETASFKRYLSLSTCFHKATPNKVSIKLLSKTTCFLKKYAHLFVMIIESNMCSPL